MKSFERYLEEDVWEPEGILDDDMPDAFEGWLEGLDTQEVIDYAEEYGSYCFTEGNKAGIVQGGELATSVVINKLK